MLFTLFRLGEICHLPAVSYGPVLLNLLSVLKTKPVLSLCSIFHLFNSNPFLLLLPIVHYDLRSETVLLLCEYCYELKKSTCVQLNVF